MISKATIQNAAGIAKHVQDTTRTAEYYSGENVPSEWVGGAAADLGMSGEVTADALVSQLEGHVTDSTGDRELGHREADGSVNRRMGWDFTVSESKSLSIELEVFGNPAVKAAIKESNAILFATMEKVGGFAKIHGELVHTGKLEIATFEHAESRRGDPDFHVHALVMNTTTHDGKAYALRNEKLFEYRRALDALKSMNEGFQLGRAGYAIQYDKAGHVELAGYTREQLAVFSKGAAEVEAELAKKGLTRESADWGDRNEANLSTRDKKSSIESRQEAGERWRVEAQAAGIRPAQYDPAIAREWNALDPRVEAAAALRTALENLIDREYTFKHSELLLETARAAEGRSTPQCVAAEIARALAAHEIVQDRANGLMTTKSAMLEEDHMRDTLEAGRHAHQAILTPAQFEQALDKFEERKAAEGHAAGWLNPGEDFHLKPQQEAAARAILTGDDRFAGVQGLPGTGKTTTLEFVREAAETAGWTVTGHSNGAEQARKMQQESGIRTVTTASHLLDGSRGKTEAQPGVRREVRIMDEASQSGQRQFNRVLDSTIRDGAKTVFLGDRYQHQSVEAGRAFERAQRHMPTAELGRESISRQKTASAKAVVAAALDRDYKRAISNMQVREIRPHQDELSPNASRAARRYAARQDNEEMVKHIGRDFADMTHEGRAHTMVLTGTNDDRRAINEAVRDAMKSRGELREAVQATTLQHVDMRAGDAGRAASYQPGQVLEATRVIRDENSRDVRAVQGERFEVARVDTRHNVVYARTSSGAERALEPKEGAFKVYTRESRELAVGDQVRFGENHRPDDQTRVTNGTRGEVTAVDTVHRTIEVRAGDRTMTIPADDAKLDHAYAVTSYSSQGRDDRAEWNHHNTEHGAHGQREATVNATRAKEVQRLYTQDVEKAARQMGVEINKTAAHDVMPDRMPQREAPQSERVDQSTPVQSPQMHGDATTPTPVHRPTAPMPGPESAPERASSVPEHRTAAHDVMPDRMPQRETPTPAEHERAFTH